MTAGEPGEAERQDTVGESWEEYFLNPYTFVPALRRADTPRPLGDGAPFGLDRLHADRWTGHIAVTLTVRTPLLLLDTAQAVAVEGTEEEHFRYPVLLRGTKPHIPATSLKGMLRSAYEAVTNSRFGVFGDYTSPLGWRRLADDAPSMKPYRVSDDGNWLEPLKPVMIRLYPPEEKTVTFLSRKPHHGDEVWFKKRKKQKKERGQIVKDENGNPIMVTWVDIKSPQGKRPKEWRSGYYFTTERNVVDKKNERIMVRDAKKSRKPITPAMRDRWDDLMQDYQAAHKPEKARRARLPHPERFIANEIGKLAWSPHLWQVGRDRIEPGALCYALMQGGEPVALYPVAISRELASATPNSMVPDGILPAPSFDLLSPADRVFGWVASGRKDDPRTLPAASRGRLRVRDVRCVTEDRDPIVKFGGDGLPLAILSAPKPSQGRFYLSQTKDDPAEPIEPGVPKSDVHQNPDRALRGRKVYWHHKAATESADYWTTSAENGQDPAQELVSGELYREFLRPRAASGDGETTGEGQRDNQNRSIEGWVGTSTQFAFTIDVRDLEDAELGALLWLLTLPDDEHLKLGFGKPLGFGSVHLDVTLEETVLHPGRVWADHYRSLNGDLPSCDAAGVITRCVRAFARAVGADDDFTSFTDEGFEQIIGAFKAAARGDGRFPVHYPRVRPKGTESGQRTPPNPAGENYAWFTANEKTGTKKGRGRSLPFPYPQQRPDEQLTVLPAEEEETPADPPRRRRGPRVRQNESRSRNRRSRRNR